MFRPAGCCPNGSDLVFNPMRRRPEKGDFGLPPSSGPVELLVHGRSLVHWDEAFRSRRPVSQRTVRADGVVVSAPLLDQDQGLAKREEDLAVAELVAEPGVERLAVSVFPG